MQRPRGSGLTRCLTNLLPQHAQIPIAGPLGLFHRPFIGLLQLFADLGRSQCDVGPNRSENDGTMEQGDGAPGSRPSSSVSSTSTWAQTLSSYSNAVVQPTPAEHPQHKNVMEAQVTTANDCRNTPRPLRGGQKEPWGV